MIMLYVYIALTVGAFIGYLIGASFGHRAGYDQGKLDANTEILEKLKEVSRDGI